MHLFLTYYIKCTAALIKLMFSIYTTQHGLPDGSRKWLCCLCPLPGYILYRHVLHIWQGWEEMTHTLNNDSSLLAHDNKAWHCRQLTSELVSLHRRKQTLASILRTTQLMTPSTTARGTSILVSALCVTLTSHSSSPFSRTSVAFNSLPSFLCFFLKLGFYSHQAVARTAGNILIRLSDSLVLPMVSSDYAESLEGYLNTALNLYQEQLQQRNISMGKTVQFVRPVPWMTSWRSSWGLILCLVPEPLKQAVQNFAAASDRLDKIVTETDFYQEK